MRKQKGFTLIELLVVITIIGLLAVALLPEINKVIGTGDSAATQARVELLRAMIDKYSNKHGEYPPSDFAKAAEGVKLTADSTNAGIECLVIHLHQKSLGVNFSLEDKPDWLKNTDGDDNKFEIPTLHTTKKFEVVDAWGNPFVYFRADSYRKPQSVMLGGEDDGGGITVNVSALKGERDYLASQKYQIISAGADGDFGTDDDVSYPPVIPK